MSLADSSPPVRSQRFAETVLLSLVLSFSLAGSTLLTHSILSPVARGSTNGPHDLLIIVPLAIVAAWAGVSVTFRMGLDGCGCAAALNKAARPGRPVTTSTTSVADR